MCKNNYRYRLGQFLTLTEVTPYPSTDMSKQFEQDKGRKFFREKLTGQFTFLKDDFTFIHEKPFNHQFVLHIDKLQNDGTYLLDWFVGEFTKTDFILYDEDNEIIETPVKPLDKYKTIIDSIEKEYDFVELSPSRSQVNLKVQPLFQIYSDLSNVLTNVLSGVQFESPVDYFPTITQDLIDVHKFNFNRTLVFIPGDDTILSPDVSGEYQQDIYASNDNQFQLVTIGFADAAFPLQTDDPDGLAESNFIVPASTLTDEDFLSIWSAPNGNTFEYIGTEIISGLPNLGFRGLIADTAPPTGILTHVSGAVNTTSLTYTSYDNTIVRNRWGMYYENPPIPEVQRYLFLAPMREGLASNFTAELGRVKKSTLFSPINGSVGNFKVFVESIYSRVLTTASNFNGSPTFDIPDQDIVSSHGRYTKVAPLSYDAYTLADDNQVEPSAYGKFSDDATNYANKYFIKPTLASSGQLIPLQISEWNEVSLWILYNQSLQDLQTDESNPYALTYSYKLSNVIKALINKIDPSLTHEEDSDHSEFLYASNSIRGSIKYPMITAKSNTLSLNQEKPVRNLKIKLSDIENFLRDYYQAYWYIDDSNRFRIEFIDYFDRGLTYSGVNTNVDLTQLIEPKTGKLWSYKDKKYSFEKSELPEQINHSWMDEVSKPFRGYPIELLDPYVEKGNLDDRQLSIFTSDIDFIHSQAGSIASSGFFFMEAVEVDGAFELPFVEVSVNSGDIVYNLQNGYASMVWAALKYWLFDLPSSDLLLNLESKTATSIKKTKTQDVEYPADDIDPMKLVISSLGNGSPKEMTINLSTGIVKTKLNHVTE